MSGAFDSLEGHRAQFLASLENIMKAAQNAQAERDRGQMSLFGDGEEAPAGNCIACSKHPNWIRWNGLCEKRNNSVSMFLGIRLKNIATFLKTTQVQPQAPKASLKTVLTLKLIIAGMITEVNHHTTKKEGRGYGGD